MKLSDETTLGYAREDTRQAIRARTDIECHCCGQNVIVYKRSLDQHHARALMFTVWLYEQHGLPVHYNAVRHPFGSPKVVLTSHYSIMKYWDLIEPVDKDHPEYPSIEKLRLGDPELPWSGYYVPTQDGLAFTDGELTVSKYRDRYNSHTVRAHGEQIGILDLEGKYFNWAETKSKMI